MKAGETSKRKPVSTGGEGGTSKIFKPEEQYDQHRDILTSSGGSGSDEVQAREGVVVMAYWS